MQLTHWLDAINGVLWHDAVLYSLLGVGVLFALWSGVGQYRALTHGTAVIRGRHDRPGDPGAINHLQALSAAWRPGSASWSCRRWPGCSRSRR